jgi:electron transfer flavoprotein beta subunit
MTQHIVVCIKSVVMKAPKGRIVRSPDLCELNPFDRPALEAALSLRERCGGSVTALSMGPASSAAALCEALAMGADRAILVSDRALAGSDTLATSTALAAALGRLQKADLIVFGSRTADSDTGQVGPQTAELLSLPLVTGVRSLEPMDGGMRVQRSLDHFIETFELDLPAAVTIQVGAILPRDVGLAGISAAYDAGKVETWSLSDVGLSPEKVGDAGSPTRVLSMRPVKKDRRCQWIEGEPSQQADQLILRLEKMGLIG